ncbi:MAG: putative ABC transporter permease [Ruminococcus sp.]|nr:putative ABC transporter permease [Ruminococcus sp.]
MDWLKSFTIFCIGAFGYGIIEIFFRGYTHITMGVLGGICLLFMSILNYFYTSFRSLVVCALISGVFITVMEGAMGYFLNLLLGLDIWDYSTAPLNVNGQICLPFSIAWVVLSLVVMPLERFLSRKIFGVEENIAQTT